MRAEDRSYYERRRRQCLASAEAASDATVARIHRELAAAYESRLEEDALERPTILVWN